MTKYTRILRDNEVLAMQINRILISEKKKLQDPTIEGEGERIHSIIKKES